MSTEQEHRGFRALADTWMNQAEERAAGPRPRRVPLTAGQHILHLLLTILTGGLWGIVWFIRAWHGNPAPDGQRR